MRKVLSPTLRFARSTSRSYGSAPKTTSEDADEACNGPELTVSRRLGLPSRPPRKSQRRSPLPVPRLPTCRSSLFRVPTSVFLVGALWKPGPRAPALQKISSSVAPAISSSVSATCNAAAAINRRAWRVRSPPFAASKIHAPYRCFVERVDSGWAPSLHLNAHVGPRTVPLSPSDLPESPRRHGAHSPPGYGPSCRGLHGAGWGAHRLRPYLRKWRESRRSGVVACWALRSRLGESEHGGLRHVGLDCGRERRLRRALLHVRVEDEVAVHSASGARPCGVRARWSVSWTAAGRRAETGSCSLRSCSALSSGFS